MAIRTVVTRGYGSGATIGLVVTRGYLAGVSASITGAATEIQIVSGGQVFTATLTNDTYVAAGTGPVGSTADTQALIDGIVSAQSGANGWNAERSGIAVTDLVRTSDTVVTLTLPALSNYAVAADETLTWTIPAVVLTAGSPVIGSPTIALTATAVVVEPKYHTVSFSLETPNMTFSSTQRRTQFNLDGRSAIISMIEEPVVTAFILLESGDFLLLESGDKVIRSG